MGNEWPMPKFHFQVKCEGIEMTCQEVSGLDPDAGAAPAAFPRKGAPEFAAIKMPGLKKTGMVTLKKLIFKADGALWEWTRQIGMSSLKRKPVTVSLIDDSGEPVMTWRLANAWPTKMIGTDLKSDGSEVAVDAIEMAHEGISVLKD